MTTRLAAVALCVSLALGACGSPETQPSGTPDPSEMLQVEVKRTKRGDAETATLKCGDEPSATGFIQDADAACAAVTENLVLLTDGPPDNIACTQIYGGPEEATIIGVIDGQEVDETVTRTDGCGIDQWNALEPVLGAPEA